MTIKVNGESKIMDKECTILELIDSLNIKVQMMAVAVNMDIVKKEEWQSYFLKEDDRVELLHFVGGG